MKLRMRNLERGMAIEVRFPTQDGYLWHPAEIAAINADFIWARYASGHIKKIDRRDDEKYRLPRMKNCA